MTQPDQLAQSRHSRAGLARAVPWVRRARPAVVAPEPPQERAQVLRPEPAKGAARAHSLEPAECRVMMQTAAAVRYLARRARHRVERASARCSCWRSWAPSGGGRRLGYEHPPLIELVRS